MYRKQVFSENTVGSNVWAAMFFPRHRYLRTTTVVHDIYANAQETFSSIQQQT